MHCFCFSNSSTIFHQFIIQNCIVKMLRRWCCCSGNWGNMIYRQLKRNKTYNYLLISLFHFCYNIKTVHNSKLRFWLLNVFNFTCLTTSPINNITVSQNAIIDKYFPKIQYKQIMVNIIIILKMFFGLQNCKITCKVAL